MSYDSQPKYPHLTEPTIAVIGSGISGLAAGNHLRELGYHNFQIFECRNTLGGRIRCEGDIELGAQWLHCHNNVIYDLAKRMGLVIEKISKFSGLQKIGCKICLTETGDQISSKIREKVEFDFGLMLARCVTDSNYESLSVGDYLEKEFSDQYAAMRICDPDLFRQHQNVFKYMMRKECVNTGCDNLQKISLSEYSRRGKTDVEPGNFVQLYPGSFSTILDALAGNLIHNHINFGYRLANVKINDKEKIELKFQIDGSETLVVVDHLILTMSLGCLKEDGGKIFRGLFCDSKKRAIENLGFGIANKFALFFDSDVVSPDTTWINLLWEGKTDNSWYFDIPHFHCIEPSLLIGWVSGDSAVEYEKLSDEQVIGDSLFVLSRFFGGKKLPKCNKIIRTFWHSDESTRGSYSYVPICGSLEDIQELSEPIWSDDGCSPKILFAGEATSCLYYSTVHGAYESGVRESKRLVDYFCGTLTEDKELPASSSDVSDCDCPSFLVNIN